jgi:protein tyrosine/serine phosphatase
MHLLAVRPPSILLAAALSAASGCFAGQSNALHQADTPVPKERLYSATRPTNWAVRLDRPGLPNFYRVTPHLYRGAQPTAQGMNELKAMGIKTVVNLRSFHSDDDELEGIGLKQGRLHMKPWHAEEEDVVSFLKLATDTNNFPVFVHCQRGADRTGMVCAMYRIVVCGWTRQEAIREMREGGFGFNSAWKNLVNYVEKADLEKIKRRAGLAR